MDKHKKRIAWVLLIAWMILIFLMSHQPGEISSSQSDLLLKVFSFIGIELNDYFGELATLIVRKVAHFSEYMILFFLSYNVSIRYTRKKQVRVLLIVFVFIYACTDELHQHFIPGRNMAFKDVLIDTSGGLFAYILITIIDRFKLRKGEGS